MREYTFSFASFCVWSVAILYFMAAVLQMFSQKAWTVIIMLFANVAILFSARHLVFLCTDFYAEHEGVWVIRSLFFLLPILVAIGASRRRSRSID